MSFLINSCRWIFVVVHFHHYFEYTFLLAFYLKMCLFEAFYVRAWTWMSFIRLSTNQCKIRNHIECYSVLQNISIFLPKTLSFFHCKLWVTIQVFEKHFFSIPLNSVDTARAQSKANFNGKKIISNMVPK